MSLAAAYKAKRKGLSKFRAALPEREEVMDEAIDDNEDLLEVMADDSLEVSAEEPKVSTQKVDVGAIVKKLRFFASKQPKETEE